MNQDYNNLNQNNMNNQDNNGIPNNQPLNSNTYSQIYQTNTNMYQQTNNELNTQANNNYQSIQNNNIQSNNEIPNNQLLNNQNNDNYQQQIHQSIENKKNKKVVFISIILLLITCVIISIILIKVITKSPSNNLENNNNIKNNKYIEYNADYSLEKRDIDYYWNIDTDYFDKTKFDGRILFFDKIINTKITGKTLSDIGYNFIESPTYYSSYDVFRIDNNEIEKDYIQKNGQWNISGKSYPIDANDVGYPYVVNFDKNDNVNSDNVEIYWNYDKTNKYIDFVTETVESNIIYPYLDGIKYDNLTIDIIIEKLGVPTYVGSILEKCLYSKGRTVDKKPNMIFAYYYVYDNDVFEFNFMHTSGKVKLVGIGYMGRRIFEHSRIDYLRNGDNNPDTSSLKSLLDEEYKEYLKNIS